MHMKNAGELPSGQHVNIQKSKALAYFAGAFTFADAVKQREVILPPPLAEKDEHLCPPFPFGSHI